MLPESFWNSERDRMFNDTQKMMIGFFFAGAVAGEGQTIDLGGSTLVDWDYVNQAVIRFLNFYRLDTITGITETTRQQSTEIIEDWLRAGDPLPKLIDRLEPIFGERRADMIGITEVTRAVSIGKIQAWESTGYINVKRWVTVGDERVCPICGNLHNKAVDLGGNFMLTLNDVSSADDPLASVLASQGELIYQSPPAHPRCRCDLRPIVDFEAFENRPLVNLDE